MEFPLNLNVPRKASSRKNVRAIRWPLLISISQPKVLRPLISLGGALQIAAFWARTGEQSVNPSTPPAQGPSGPEVLPSSSLLLVQLLLPGIKSACPKITQACHAWLCGKKGACRGRVPGACLCNLLLFFKHFAFMLAAAATYVHTNIFIVCFIWHFVCLQLGVLLPFLPQLCEEVVKWRDGNQQRERPRSCTWEITHVLQCFQHFCMRLQQEYLDPCLYLYLYPPLHQYLYLHL